MKLKSFSPRVARFCRGWISAAVMFCVLHLLSSASPAQTYLPSTNDLWDVSQGSVVTGTSGAHVPYSDIRDMFGGEFGGVDKGSTVFEDGEPAGFIHYVEWQTPVPVTVNAFNLFATGDGPAFDNQREFSQFVLKARSSPLATNFDLTLYTLVVTNHPYTFVDPVNFALVSTNITPVTAQYFRAEFTQYTAGRGFDGPRVIELDGFGTRSPSCTPPASGLVSWWAAEGNANDSFGTNNGTLLGGVSFTNGEVGEALSLDGVTGSMSVPASASLDVGTNGGFTIEGWIKPASLTVNEPLVEWNDGLNDAGWNSLGSHFWINQPTDLNGGGPGSLFANIVDTSGAFHPIASGGNLLATNGFSHVALTYDKSSGTAALYLNGSNVASQNLGVFTPRTAPAMK